MKSDKELIEGCLKSHRKAQKQLYEKFAPNMIHVCRRYSNDENTAKDVMQEGFIKVFNKIVQLKDSGKLEAWIKQIMITQSLMRLRKKEKLVFFQDTSLEEKQNVEIFADESFQYNKSDLNKILKEMPKGYKVIFNMYVFDDYSHKEISQAENPKEEKESIAVINEASNVSDKANQIEYIETEIRPNETHQASNQNLTVLASRNVTINVSNTDYDNEPSNDGSLQPKETGAISPITDLNNNTKPDYFSIGAQIGAIYYPENTPELETIYQPGIYFYLLKNKLNGESSTGKIIRK